MAVHEAIVVLAHGSTDPEGNFSQETGDRLDAAIDMFNDGISEVLVMTGNKAFTMREQRRPVADAMRDEALARGVPASAILADNDSLDTVGNGYFTKTGVLIPQGIKDILLLTSPSHVDRSATTFCHVLGDEYTVSAVGSRPAVRKAQDAYELLGAGLQRAVLNGTEPGDHEAIYRRLQDIVPGYAERTLGQRALSYAQALPRLFTPVD
jgi:uncharacterized SAM-binding protein YcdF (DUF218 family)